MNNKNIYTFWFLCGILVTIFAINFIGTNAPAIGIGAPGLVKKHVKILDKKVGWIKASITKDALSPAYYYGFGWVRVQPGEQKLELPKDKLPFPAETVLTLIAEDDADDHSYIKKVNSDGSEASVGWTVQADGSATMKITIIGGQTITAPNVTFICTRPR